MYFWVMCCIQKRITRYVLSLLRFDSKSKKQQFFFGGRSFPLHLPSGNNIRNIKIIDEYGILRTYFIVHQSVKNVQSNPNNDKMEKSSFKILFIS